MKIEVFKKIEMITNVAIIAAVVMLGFLLIQKSFSPKSPQKQDLQISKGTKISLPDVNWAQNRKTLVLVLQKDCKFCSESMNFYQTLVEKSKEKGIQLVAVLPDSREEGFQYLKKNGVEIQEIRQVQTTEINVKGTPTLILINNKGEVEDSWTGKLPSEEEKEVIASL